MLWGILNVLIEGKNLGSIVFNGSTIAGVYPISATLPLNVGTWFDGQRWEAYPAFIDIHVHDRWGEPGKEDPDHLAAACIEGGVGTILPMPNTDPPFTWIDQIESRFEMLLKTPLTVLGWLGSTRDNHDHIRQVLRYYPQRVPGSKLMMAKTNNPQIMVDDRPSQRRILEVNAECNGIVVVHAEAEDMITWNREQLNRERSNLTVHDHCQIRASEVEVEGIRRILDIHLEVGGGRLHICHVSTPKGVQLIREAQDRDQQVTCETCPHYWILNSSKLQGPNAGFYKMNPALRSEPEQLALLNELCNGGIDAIATDHAPHELHLKSEQGLDKCPSGVPGVQTVMLLTYALKQQHLIDSERFIDLTSRNAARMLKLNKGTLAPGFDADVILINPQTETVIRNEEMLSKATWTPFHGMQINATIETVIFGGKILKGQDKLKAVV